MEIYASRRERTDSYIIDRARKRFLTPRRDLRKRGERLDEFKRYRQAFRGPRGPDRQSRERYAREALEMRGWLGDHGAHTLADAWQWHEADV